MADTPTEPEGEGGDATPKDGADAKGAPAKDGKAKQSRGDVDPFWLEKVFPDPAAVFGFESHGADDLAATCIFVLDTNILVAPYELGPDSVQDIENIYRGLAKNDRLFVPAQAAREYGKIRGLKIAEVYKAVQDRASTVPSTADLKCPILEGVQEYEIVKKKLEELRPRVRELTDALAELKDALTNWGWKDRVSTLYRELFTPDRIIEHGQIPADVTKNLAFRSAHSTPPSYKDASKMDGGIGDLLIWYSLMAIAKKTGKDVVFVCNDGKADWSIRSNKEAILPRSELTLEFHRETGRTFAIMNWKRFLKSMNATAKTIEEAKILETRFEPIGDRIWSLLEQLWEILSKVVEEWEGLGEEERGIHDEQFSTLLSELEDATDRAGRIAPNSDLFRRAKLAYDMAVSIDSDNKFISYLNVRGKHSAEEYQAAMLTKIQSFLVLYQQYADAADYYSDNG